MFIARQPIFNRMLDVFGYELLFRLTNTSQKFNGVSSQEATATVLGGLFESGIDAIVDNKYAFINFDEDFIHSDALELIPPDRLIIEVLEGIKVSDQLVNRIAHIKRQGYKIALDDFAEDYTQYPLAPLANIIKFDIMQTPLHAIGLEVELALGDGKVILAEKVETNDQYLQAKKMGFQLFQGYFFSKPNIVSQSGYETSSKNQYTHLLWELKQEEPSYDKLVEIMQRDVHLAYRFMRVISHRSKDTLFDSIKRALTFMGLAEIERWISILMLQDLGKKKPHELATTSLIRARFAEQISMKANLRKIKHEASMMGLFSTLDAVLDQTMEEALEGIALTRNIKEALIEHKGPLYPIYQLILAYEKGDWEAVTALSRDVEIKENVLCSDYLAAIKWANEVSFLMA